MDKNVNILQKNNLDTNMYTKFPSYTAKLCNTVDYTYTGRECRVQCISKG